MKSNNFLKLAVARPRGAGIAAAALAACGAALAPTGAQAAGYSFQTINDPADIPPPPGAGGLTFTNLMGITSNGDTIPGFYGSGQAGDPNTGFVLTLPGKTFTSSNATFPGLAPPFNAAQTQMTAVNGNGTTFTGYTYPTNNGVPVDFQFGFYEQGGVFTMVNNPKTPDCGTTGVCDSGVITENQLIGVNNANLAVGFYNDIHGDSHGYTYDIATRTFSADINDPLAVSTVTAAINNSDEIAGFFTDPGGVIHGFIDNGGAFQPTVDPTGCDRDPAARAERQRDSGRVRRHRRRAARHPFRQPDGHVHHTGPAGKHLNDAQRPQRPRPTCRILRRCRRQH